MKEFFSLVVAFLGFVNLLGAEPQLKPGTRIVTLGDSITQAGGYQRLMRRVFDRFYADLNVEIVNAGISGHKSPDMAGRLQKDVIDKNPTIVTISCGVNDVWHGFYDPPRGVDLATYTDLMRQMVRELKAKTAASIYLLTPTVIHETLSTPENLKLEEYCVAVRRIAKDEQVHLIDLNTLFNLSLRATQIGGASEFHPTSDGVHMKPSGDFLIAAAILSALEIPTHQILAVTEPLKPSISADDSRFQYWGRWDLRNASSEGAFTVNTGSTILARFQGAGLIAHFTISQYTHQFPTLWVQIDDGEWSLAIPDEELQIAVSDHSASSHVLRLVVKGFREWETRWETPLVSAVIFRGVTPLPETRLLPAPERPDKLIEYLGDSITEGVLAMASGPRESWTREHWPQYTDGRRTWAYQSALLAGAEPRTVGFGRLGLSINANGGVPPALSSFEYNFSGSPVDRTRLPQVVVINLGSNDRDRVSTDLFGALYQAYVQQVRKSYPEAMILCMRPFNGSHGEMIAQVVKTLRDERVRFVDTTGWIEPGKDTTDKVHLNLNGNKIAAEKLAPILRSVL
jgi:lysophospholipase L1-like esterase